VQGRPGRCAEAQAVAGLASQIVGALSQCLTLGMVGLWHLKSINQIDENSFNRHYLIAIHDVWVRNPDDARSGSIYTHY